MSTITIKQTFESETNINNIFIPTNKNWQSTETKNLSILESGSEKVLMQKICKAISEAEEMICLQSFLIQDTDIISCLVEAVEDRSVKVFVMDSAETKLEGRIFEEDESFITKEYKTLVNTQFRNKFVHRQAKNLHTKFIVIDPKTNPKGFLCTGNFNEKPFVENPELAVPLNPQQVKDFFNVFVYHFWQYTTDEQNTTETFDKVKPIKSLELPDVKNILITSPNSELSNMKSKLLDAVNKAERKIQLSTFGLDINHQLSQAILNKIESGLEVEIFCRLRQKTIINHIEKLAQKGAKVFCHPLIHAKSLIIDGKEAYIFTANFEAHGLDSGFDTGVKLLSNQVNDLKKIYDNWKASFPYQYFAEYPLKNIDKTYFQFDKENRRIKETILDLVGEKKNERKIKIVKDFIQFFSEIEEPQNITTSKIDIVKEARFENLKTEILDKKPIAEHLYLISYETTQKKKQITKEAILIESHEEIKELKTVQQMIETLQKQKGFLNLEIFTKDGKN